MSFYKMYRGWMDNPVFNKEPLSEREAWCWLIENAAWKDRQFRIGSNVIDLTRGQIGASFRFLADAWGWSKNRTHRYIMTLQKANMVRVESGTEAGRSTSVITICNYEIYQSEEFCNGTESGTETGQKRDRCGTDAGQMRDKTEESKEVKERKEYIYNPPTPLTDDGFSEFWKTYPRKTARGAAVRAFAKAAKKVGLEKIMQGVREYAKSCVGKEQQFIAHASTWLNQERWEDFIENDQKGLFGNSEHDYEFEKYKEELKRLYRM